MNSHTRFKREVFLTLQKYNICCVQITDHNSDYTISVILDDKTPSTEIKKLVRSFKAQNFKCQCSFCPETWELTVVISK
jgi:aspartokinase